jgi:hypothetical protein
MAAIRAWAALERARAGNAPRRIYVLPQIYVLPTSLICPGQLDFYLNLFLLLMDGIYAATFGLGAWLMALARYVWRVADKTTFDRQDRLLQRRLLMRWRGVSPDQCTLVFGNGRCLARVPQQLECKYVST